MIPELGQAVLGLFDDHRTIRRFRADAIGEDDRRALERAAQRAPSGALVQLGTFIRITDPELRETLTELSGGQPQVRQAPEFYVACIDVRRDQHLIEHRGSTFALSPRFTFLYGLLDVALMAANLATAAEAMGYGVCYIGAFQNRLDEVVRVLELPRGVLPVVGICAGRPERPLPERRGRLSPDAVFMENRYRELDSDELERCFRDMTHPKRSFDWFQALQRYWCPNGLAAQREEVLRRVLAEQGFA